MIIKFAINCFLRLQFSNIKKYKMFDKFVHPLCIGPMIIFFESL